MAYALALEMNYCTHARLPISERSPALSSCVSCSLLVFNFTRLVTPPSHSPRLRRPLVDPSLLSPHLSSQVPIAAPQTPGPKTSGLGRGDGDLRGKVRGKERWIDQWAAETRRVGRRGDEAGEVENEQRARHAR